MAAADTLIWQALASIIIPGVTVNQVCTLSLFLFKRIHQPAAEDQPAHHECRRPQLHPSHRLAHRQGRDQLHGQDDPTVAVESQVRLRLTVV
ncbi:hypothetical protein HPB48_005791 [Haemaphysalis longicornis]|uniref:Uncharacterized protein n=1 Tax=Haemaphysalis longicornis TaxID=44386 RepID=A0A9J6FS62_HAELO|nr:hypothetical protein HPB48_005791 [Haemaphysalis longicornis]